MDAEPAELAGNKRRSFRDPLWTLAQSLGPLQGGAAYAAGMQSVGFGAWRARTRARRCPVLAAACRRCGREVAAIALVVGGIVGVAAGWSGAGTGSAPGALGAGSETRLGILAAMIGIHLLVSVERSGAQAAPSTPSLGPYRSPPPVQQRRGATALLLSALLVAMGTLGLIGGGAGRARISAVEIGLDLLIATIGAGLFVAEARRGQEGSWESLPSVSSPIDR